MQYVGIFSGEMDVEYKERIITYPRIMLGKPVIKGTKITVELILRKLLEGIGVEESLKAYPHWKRKGVLVALSYFTD